MSDALFSDFWMAGRAATAVSHQPRTAARARTLGEQARPGVTDALAEALAHALPAAQFDTATLATAVADIIAGRSVILHLNADLDAPHRAAVRTFLDQLIRVTGTLDETRQEAAIAKLAEVILPDDLAAARGALAADNLALRDRFIAQTAPLTSAEVGARAGARSTNPYATAARWKKAGDIFSVHHRGTEYYPAFQFRDGRPHPVIRKALAELPASMSPWQRAFWFVSTNGWLDDAAPADRLDDSDAVVAAAAREAQEVAG